jgi:CBS domain-containing protein
VVVVTQSLRGLTAGKLMSFEVVTIPESLPVRDAARRLAAARVSGAPVVDESGCCVGVLSVTDIARWATLPPAPSAGPSRTCSFWEHGCGAAGEDVAVCQLAPGACALQRRQAGPNGKPLTACTQPHGVCVGEWQVLEPAETSDGTVREFMTPDPVTASADTPIRSLTRMMIDASVHRVIVVDDAGRPVGIVSSTDVLAAVARCSPDAGEDEDLAAGEPAIYAGG